MKLLIATGIFPPDIGGPATYSALLLQNLPARGIEVEVVTYGRAGISRSWPKGLRHVIYFFSLLKKGYQSDVIFAQDTVSAGLPAFVAAKILRKKFFIRVPGDYAWEQGVQRFGVKETIDEFQTKTYKRSVHFLRLIQKTVVGHADVVITPSLYFKKVVSGWTDRPDSIQVIYNGIDFSRMTSPTVHSLQKFLVSVGRLVPWKGFRALIDLMMELPDWKLAIVGEGPDEALLKEKVQSLGLQDRIEFTGAVSSEKLQKIFASSSIFVLNTTFESFSFALVEAMQAGLLPIVSRVGNLAEIVTDGENGVLVEPDDIRTIKTYIKKAESNSDWFSLIGKNARERAQHFSIDRTLDELESVLKKTIS